MDLANELLGYMYSIEGVIEHGFKRGSTLLNFPTANLGANPDYLVPSSGVYAGFVCVNDTLYGSMINVGNNPTFENKKFQSKHISLILIKIFMIKRFAFSF